MDTWRTPRFASRKDGRRTMDRRNWTTNDDVTIGQSWLSPPPLINDDVAVAAATQC